MKWITREKPKIDRIECPLLIRRFIDADAGIIYVSHDEDCRHYLGTGPALEQAKFFKATLEKLGRKGGMKM